MRTYSSLLFLKALMDQIESVVSEETDASELDSAQASPDKNINYERPAEVFDFIYGSSSGG